MATSVVANAAVAYRLPPRLGAQLPTSPLVERYSELLESRFVRAMVTLGLVVGLFTGGVVSGVDAYDGSVKLYAWEDSDPVLKAWSQAFPGVVQPKSAISQDLLDHLRYPQDFFKVQRQILASYHMTNPDNWYQRSSLWDVPNDPVAGASARTKEPPFPSRP